MYRRWPPLSYRMIGVLGRGLVRLAWGRRWHIQSALPPGPFIVCSNHLSNIDPVTLGDFLISQGHYPCYLAKDSLFTMPVLRSLLRSLGVIPVSRGSAKAAGSLTHAARALEAGRCVVIYPEGTFTNDADLWPMEGKTGAIRLAAATGVPIIPVAQWGPQQILPPSSSRLRLIPRPTAQLIVGVPIKVPAQADHDSQARRAATDSLMDSITVLLRTLR